MIPTPSGAGDTDTDLSRQRLRRVVVKIFAVQIVTLLALWLLNAVFGAS